ncbi:MAG: SDR family oxidoreductase [Myxococcota bacterium]
MSRWTDLQGRLRADPQAWLVTGAAGFIGSHLVESLLGLGQTVRGVDDFSTGHAANLEDVADRVGPEASARFELLEGDLRDPAVCEKACEGAPRVLHQAALGSVPRSVADPVTSFGANVTGFVNLLEAARTAGVPRFVYASSSSVYGDHPGLPKVEDQVGEPLSPYAATKWLDEVWARIYHRSYGMPVVGMRYFNVFGPRQDPHGPYAAVIPRWIEALVAGETPRIFGDGETSRDFCPVANVVQANLLAAFAEDDALGRAYNVALGGRTNLTELFTLLRDGLAATGVDCGHIEAVYEDFRPGDVRHSLADLAAARKQLGYEPEVDFPTGVRLTVEWHAERAKRGDAA